MRVIFLDYDGVIRIPPSEEGGWAPRSFISPSTDFCPAAMKRLSWCISELGAKVVISSDWRDFGKEECLKHILPHLPDGCVHDDWATIRSHGLTRWMEVALWLEQHPEVEGFTILEDTKRHFDGAPERISSRIIWCNNRHGFAPVLVPRLMELFPATATK